MPVVEIFLTHALVSLAPHSPVRDLFLAHHPVRERVVVYGSTALISGYVIDRSVDYIKPCPLLLTPGHPKAMGCQRTRRSAPPTWNEDPDRGLVSLLSQVRRMRVAVSCNTAVGWAVKAMYVRTCAWKVLRIGWRRLCYRSKVMRLAYMNPDER